MAQKDLKSLKQMNKESENLSQQSKRRYSKCLCSSKQSKQRQSKVIVVQIPSAFLSPIALCEETKSYQYQNSQKGVFCNFVVTQICCTSLHMYSNVQNPLKTLSKLFRGGLFHLMSRKLSYVQNISQMVRIIGWAGCTFG